MPDILYKNTITANGVYRFPARDSVREYVVEVSGNLGGGTAKIGYVDRNGTVVDYDEDGPSFIAALPSSGRFAVTVAGATGAFIKFTANPLQ